MISQRHILVINNTRLHIWAWLKNKGETTHQIGAKRLTGETTQGETTHGRNDPGPVWMRIEMTCRVRIVSRDIRLIKMSDDKTGDVVDVKKTEIGEQIAKLVTKHPCCEFIGHFR